MAGNTALDSDDFDSEDSGLNALLGRLDDLGDSSPDKADTSSRGLHSVPDLDDYDYSSIAAIDPDAMGAAIDPAPVELSLVPDLVEDDVADDDVVDVADDDVVDVVDVVDVADDDVEDVVDVADVDDVVEVEHSAPAHALVDETATETAPVEAESTPEVHETEEKIDHFADLDDGVVTRIAGVQSEPVRPKIEAQELASKAGNQKSKMVHPGEVAEFDARDEFGVLADPLDIKEITPTHPDDANPEILLNHGVYFPAIVAGAPWAKGLRARPGDLPEEDTGQLPVRLLLVATLLVCMIGVTVMLLNDPANVNMLRETLSGLFG